jgi:deoxyribodipyrimidine photo-lyase
MQSGQTGINTPRIYNPVKQGLDQDPDGRFIRRWVPELADVPLALLHTPWLADGGAGIAGYPPPLVDPVAAARAARERLTEQRRTLGYRDAARQVFERHGSRKRTIDDDRVGGARRKPRPRPAADAPEQLSLELDPAAR